MKQKVKYNFVRKHCNKNSENETKSKAFHLLYLHIVYSFLFWCRRKLKNIFLLLLREVQDYTDSFDKKRNSLSTWKNNLDSLTFRLLFCLYSAKCIPSWLNDK